VDKSLPHLIGGVPQQSGVLVARPSKSAPAVEGSGSTAPTILAKTLFAMARIML